MKASRVQKVDSDKPLYFISYSRKHFYAAEWLALSLEKDGYNTWLDVQELLPGIRWEAAINDGLTRSVGMILVASQAAIASPYVEKEWANIQGAGKRVCVCVVEDVELPDRLQRPDVTLIDMRRNFDRALQQVKAFIDEQPIRDKSHAIRKSLRFGIHWATPVLIRNSILAWYTLAVLNVLAALIMVIGILTSGTHRALLALIPLILSIGAARLFWRWGSAYKNRTFTVQQINGVGGAALLTCVGFGVGSVLLGTDATAHLNGIGFFLLIFIFLVLILLIIDFGRGGDPVRYRWLPTGEATDIERRMRINRLLTERRFSLRNIALSLVLPYKNLFTVLSRFVIDALPPIIIVRKDNPHPVKFSLTHAPADTYLADRIRFTMREYGHTPVPTVEQAEYQMIVVSEATPETAIIAATQHPIPPVFILSAPIALSSDSPASKYQWLDYRRRSQTQLNAVARVLRTDQNLTLQERINYSETFLPLNFSSILFPQILDYSMIGFRLFGALLVIASVLTFLYMIINSVFIPLAALLGTLSLASGAWLIFVEHQIFHRQGRLRQAYAGVIVGFGWLIAIVLAGIVATFNSLSAAAPNSDTTLQSDLLGVLYPMLIIAVAALLLVIAEVRLWLPAPGSASDTADPVRLSHLRRSPHWQPGLINAVLLALLISLIVYLAFRSA